MPYFVGRPDLNNGSRLWKEQKPADEEGKTPETQEPVKTPKTEQKPGENTTHLLKGQ